MRRSFVARRQRLQRNVTFFESALPPRGSSQTPFPNLVPASHVTLFSGNLAKAPQPTVHPVFSHQPTASECMPAGWGAGSKATGANPYQPSLSWLRKGDVYLVPLLTIAADRPDRTIPIKAALAARLLISPIFTSYFQLPNSGTSS
jgi:hypothetical protein